MINEIIYWELYALVVSFFNGVLLAWIYDNKGFQTNCTT